MIRITDYYYMTEEENLRENLLLQEMGATLRKKDTGLPMNIYVDTCKDWPKYKHWKHIKFQHDTSDHPNTRNTLSMSISDDPEILVKNTKMTLNAKQLDKLKAFVKANKQDLLDLADAKMSIIDFWKRMKRV